MNKSFMNKKMIQRLNLNLFFSCIIHLAESYED